VELEPDKFKKMLPLPVTVITTVNGEGISNAAPYGCVMPILRPLNLIAIASAPPRHTLKNIRETGEFLINVMGRPSFDRAMMTAKNYPFGTDELKESGLQTEPARKISPLRISDALGWIEAVVEKEVAGDFYVLTIGRVVCAEMNDLYVRQGLLAESPVAMLASEYRVLGETVGDVRETMKLFLASS
jgi:flavin reductase (DIM6/NTAB) family NADH-FMN oxidoreductase RutF